MPHARQELFSGVAVEDRVRSAGREARVRTAGQQPGQLPGGFGTESASDLPTQKPCLPLFVPLFPPTAESLLVNVLSSVFSVSSDLKSIRSANSGTWRRISSSIMRRWEKIFFSAASYTRIPTWGAGVSSGEQGDNKLGRIEGRVHGQMGSSLRTYLKAAREALALVPMRGRSFPHHLIFPSIMSTAWALNTSGSKCSPIHSFM